uniref:Nucleoplasmin core domain-containing protein n=1 Tax=Trichuris muris TaxID=70415 RepID=A0A5S6QDN5_TRIMR
MFKGFWLFKKARKSSKQKPLNFPYSIGIAQESEPLQLDSSGEKEMKLILAPASRTPLRSSLKFEIGGKKCKSVTFATEPMVELYYSIHEDDTESAVEDSVEEDQQNVAAENGDA